MLIGYARVSTGEQNLDLQRDALQEAGCTKIFTDQMSGAKAERPGLTEALAFLRQGDTLVVWKLDRLGRSLHHLVETVHALQGRGIDLKSLQDHIDTSTSVGKFQFHIFSALAEFERDIIRDRTNAGLRAARARGRLGGRPKRLTPAQVKLAASLMKNPELSIKEVCQAVGGVSKATLYRYVSPGGEVRQKVQK